MFRYSNIINNADGEAIMLIDNNLEANRIAQKIGGEVIEVTGNDFSFILKGIDKNTAGYSVWLKYGLL